MKKSHVLSTAIAILMVLSMITGCAKTATPTQASTQMPTTAATVVPSEAASVAPSTEATAAATAPTVLEPITLRVACPDWSSVAPPMKDLWFWAEYEKKTKVHIDWDPIAQTAMNDKKTTLMASGDLPDMFWQFYVFTPAELLQYGSQGTFVSLDDKLGKLPNLSELLKDVSSAKSSMTMPDGHIYGFPYVQPAASWDSLRYYINKKLLTQTGLPIPATLEDYENVLKAFKDLKVDGKSVSPLEVANDTFVWTFEAQMMGAFGLGDNGLRQVNSWTYNPGDSKLKFIYTDSKLKEMWQMFARWFKEGYIHPLTFTTGGYTYDKWVADGTAGLVGSFSWLAANNLYADAPKDYVAVNQFKGPYSQVLSWIDTPVRGVVNGIITNKCKYLDRALSWMDYWYSDEGSLFGWAGTEGVTYVMKDGKYCYTDDIQNYKGGVQLGAFQKGLLTYGGSYPYLEPPEDIVFQLQNTTFEDFLSCSKADLNAVLPKEIWPMFIANKDEQEQLDTFYTDMDTFIKENRIKFITGKQNFDADWDTYVKTLNGMGVAKLLTIRQAQFDRYKASMK